MKKTTGFDPCVQVDTTASGAGGQAGGVLLTETVMATGFGGELSVGLVLWRRPSAVHDPAVVLLDLAVTLTLGGDHLADVALLRSEPGGYRPVASDPTVSRTIDALAGEVPTALRAADTARAPASERAWALAGTGEPLSILLRPRIAGSNTAADHVKVIKDALGQLPGHRPGTRAGRKVLIRTDGARATHAVLDFPTTQQLSYSVGFTLPENIPDLLQCSNSPPAGGRRRMTPTTPSATGRGSPS